MSIFEIVISVLTGISVVVALVAVYVSFQAAHRGAMLAHNFDEVGRARWAKITCLRTLMANRHAISKLGTDRSREAFFAALNEIPVTFHADPEVMSAWRNVSMAIHFDGGPNADQIMDVLRAAANAVDQPIPVEDQRFLTQPFVLNREAVERDQKNTE